AYFPSCTISVTTCTFRDVAFWPRVPVLLHSLRSPDSKLALKMILAEAVLVRNRRNRKQLCKGLLLRGFQCGIKARAAASFAALFSRPGNRPRPIDLEIRPTFP